MNTADTALATRIDLAEASRNNALAVCFPQSRSASYEAAVNLAQQASMYSEAPVGRAIFHYAVFERTLEQARLARSLVGFLRGQKGAQMFVGGRLHPSANWLGMVLECYINASACNDWRAHCQSVVSEAEVFSAKRSTVIGFSVRGLDTDDIGKVNLDEVLNGPKEAAYLWPCRYMSGTRLSRAHPSTPVDQLQAAAINRWCEWCPNFKPGDFRQLEAKP